MIISYDDIFDTSDCIIAHGVNNIGAMGAGIAKTIKKKFNSVYIEYTKQIDSYIRQNNEPHPLGYTQYVNIDNNRIIANCFTQSLFIDSNNPSRVVSYDALDLCFKELRQKSSDLNMVCRFPLIGGGLGGGDSDIIKAIISKHFPDNTGILHLL